MFKGISALLDRLFAVAGALIFSQAPQFFLQYIHRLSGHVEELKVHISAIQQAADKNGKGLGEYVQKFVSHPDLDFASQGEMMQSMLRRYEELQHSLFVMQQSTPFTRPFHFLAHMNREISQATFRDFTPGLAWSLEGFVYALAGVAIGVGLYHLLRSLFILLLRSTPFRYTREN